MIAQLRYEQVSIFWDVIKVCLVKANKVPKEYELDFTNKHLELILSGKVQCWVAFSAEEDGGRKLHTVFTSRIVDDDLYGIRYLLIETIYGFRKATEEMYEEGIRKLKEFAKRVDCKTVIANTHVQVIKDMLFSNGFTEHYITYRCDV